MYEYVHVVCRGLKDMGSLLTVAAFYPSPTVTYRGKSNVTDVIMFEKIAKENLPGFFSFIRQGHVKKVFQKHQTILRRMCGGVVGLWEYV